MPSLEISREDLQKLLGLRLSIEEMEELLMYAKCSIEAVEGDLVKVSAKDTNRPDLWSTEGIAREIRFRIVKHGLPSYKVRDSGLIVNVTEDVSEVRPYTVCATVTKLKLDPFALSQMIQLQEKVALSFGRHRREVAIGVYDLDKIKPPIMYTTVEPDGIRFVPLDFEEALTPREILEKHPKGREFGYLLEGAKRYPMFVDSAGEVLSIPPIINSNYSGKVTENTSRVFIECSGFNLKLLSVALNVICAALAERGGLIGRVKVRYPDKMLLTPDLTPKKAHLRLSYLNKISGFQFSLREACGLLRKSGYEVMGSERKLEVLYPAYRQDIMHERDIVEDVLISYGYNSIQPLRPALSTIGKSSEIEEFSNIFCNVMIGLGFQEILSYMLTNKGNLFKKMNLTEEPLIELQNPVSSSWDVFRNSLFPCLMEFLSNNTHVDYPQKIFEIGDVVVVDEEAEAGARDVRKLACAMSDATMGYEEISSILDALLRAIGIKYELRRGSHPSFLSGRIANVVAYGEEVGFIGEVSPEVLANWRLENPVAGFEIDLNKLMVRFNLNAKL